MLEGATFFSDIELVLPGIKAPLDAGTAPELVKYIDDAAKQMPLHPDYRRNNFQRQTIVNKELNVDFLKRGICWNVAQGNLLWWKPYIRYGQDLDNKFNGRILRTINAEAAFPFLNYDGNLSPKHELSITSKPSYRLAYVLMVHSNTDNIAALINALADPTVFIYIHVDLGASESFHEEIRKLVEGRTDIAIMPTPFAVAWAHISLIWVELRAFFDLLDLIQFEYIINLSGTDYPRNQQRRFTSTSRRSQQVIGFGGTPSLRMPGNWSIGCRICSIVANCRLELSGKIDVVTRLSHMGCASSTASKICSLGYTRRRSG